MHRSSTVESVKIERPSDNENEASVAREERRQCVVGLGMGR